MQLHDEYGTNLLQAAGQIWIDRTDTSVTEYLVNIETEHMALSAAPGIEARALGVAKAIRKYVETLRS